MCNVNEMVNHYLLFQTHTLTHKHYLYYEMQNIETLLQTGKSQQEIHA